MSYLYIKDTGNDHARLLISVPKKTFKRAVKRNLYKRRIRESWRRQKHLLTEGTGIDIMIKYASKELLTQHIKEKDKCPPNQTKEEEIGNLPDKEF